MLIHGYELISEWKNSTCGKYAVARKDGRKYFLKKYQTPVAPIDNGTLDKKTFEHKKKVFDAFLDYRKKINAAIRTVAGEGGNIVIPREEFLDGNQLVEVSELVEGAIPREKFYETLAHLPDDVRKLLMMTAAGALYGVHSKGIVHSDIKPENVLLAMNAAGNYVAKLIDFSASYFVDRKPEDEIAGTVDYYSPELGAYATADEDELEEAAARITVKSDIFSLGLLFHFYLTGELPEAINLTEKLAEKKKRGRIIYCWIALNCGCDIKISDEITDPVYRSLISDMLSINPEDRPDAMEVLKRLKGSAPVAKGHRTAPAPVPAPPAPAPAPIPSGLPEPWPEHKIVFDAERLKSRGFVSGERKLMGGVKGYQLYRKDSSSSFFRVEMLVGLKYAVNASSKPEPAVKTAAVEGFAEPWPEHHVVFNTELLRTRGYVGSERASLDGVAGYRFFRKDGTEQFIRIEMLMILSFAGKV